MSTKHSDVLAAVHFNYTGPILWQDILNPCSVANSYVIDSIDSGVCHKGCGTMASSSVKVLAGNNLVGRYCHLVLEVKSC